jgi:hypothetical protein
VGAFRVFDAGGRVRGLWRRIVNTVAVSWRGRHFGYGEHTNIDHVMVHHGRALMPEINVAG